MLECSGCGPARRKATSPSGDIYERLYQDAAERREIKRKEPEAPLTLTKSLTQSHLFVTQLTQKHRVALDKIVLLRKERRDQELSELKPAPTINRRSQELARGQAHRKSKQGTRRNTVYHYDGPKEVEIKLEEDCEDRQIPSRQDSSSVCLSDLLGPKVLSTLRRERSPPPFG